MYFLKTGTKVKFVARNPHLKRQKYAKAEKDGFPFKLRHLKAPK